MVKATHGLTRSLTHPLAVAPSLLTDLGAVLPPNYMPFSEDPTKFNWLVGGTGAAIPHIWSAGSTLTLGTKTIVCDIPGGEATKGYTCTGMDVDPDNSNNLWLGNLGPTRNGYPGTGGNLTATSIVQMTKAGAFVSQVFVNESAQGSIQGVTVVREASGAKYLAYASGNASEPYIFFIARDGSPVRTKLALPFVPNALDWDNARQALVIGDSSNGDLWWVTLGGVFLRYADFKGWPGGFDQISIDLTRGTGGYVWGTAGANGSTADLVAYDIDLDKIVNRWVLGSAFANEGLLVDATTIYSANDGFFHQYGSAPNSSAPNNENSLQTYAVPSVTQWDYARVYKSSELTGPYGRQPYHLILNRGPGNTSADYCIITRDADASINGQTAILSWSGKSFDPAGTANLGMRLLSGGSMTNKVFGASYSRPTLSNTFASGANNTQLGTRGTQTPDNVVNMVGTALAVNLGAVSLPYKARVGA
ncbi:hypothetical protein [Bradyrhizobium sp. LA2.1]|uniref:hypothetical protein n=1 Tax=Bradyrhizobium sp. LA2.1 TaxID=3156376 RepID=UPI003392D04A